MLKSYFKIAVRNLWKHKVFSLINIAGLALGMACSLLILLWVQDERQVDGFHKNSSRLYSVYLRSFPDGKVDASHATPGLLAEELRKVMPEVELAAGFAWSTNNSFSVKDKILKEDGNAAGPEFFRMFSYPLLAGNAADALKSPESIAISRKMAVAFFGSPEQAIEKTIRYDDRKDFTVTAVFEDLPANASEKFDFLLNWEFMKKENEWLTDWNSNGPNTYLLLRPDANIAQLENKLLHFPDAYNKANKGPRYEMGLQRFDAQYLHSHFENGYLSGGRIEYVHLFSLVAIFILLIACINFMNLTTARSVNRLKEIGVRKAMGAVRWELIRQFVGEAIIVAFLSAILASLIVWIALPAFNGLTGKQIVLPFIHPVFWLMLTVLAIFTGILSGSYPALFLSSFNAIQVLKGTLKSGSGSLWFRKSLVVFQFVLSIILIISTILISRQIQYVQHTNLGFDRENLIYIPLEGDLIAKQDVLKQAAMSSPYISAVSKMMGSPTTLDARTSGVDWEGRNPGSTHYFTHTITGYDFIKTLHLQMLQGRDFSKDFATDSSGYILNEAALKVMDLKDPIGKYITFWGKRGQIIGIVRNFHFQSLHNAIDPLIMRLEPAAQKGFLSAFTGNTFLVRTRPGKTKQALATLEQLYKQLNPKFPFTYKFSDEEYFRLYKSEEVIGRLSVIFAVLAIFISCLGLLGLSIFTAEQKAKEISIRKVMGASAASLFGLLSTDFMILVGIAYLIAAPLAWWAMHQWLQQFAYKTDISWWVFGLSGLLAVLIALGTVSFQAIKAININLIKSLRGE
ncbi:ABC-type antimicrobial peptide transport system permease subunit [Chitinophaga niastensis]|uniref:ABC-type antimicrobial peptide transport system permease subunit n=1 Tax=Chitinophaga niastensis TaxID=536980 RepID=A0A2P8HEV5_CHINA|nr:ABC transporter permease [Chitinophaga niastensis]PSL44714.1 ABC-type antimicrobial peptide transport system permease subunit [Chitinophaga niastensis]